MEEAGKSSSSVMQRRGGLNDDEDDDCVELVIASCEDAEVEVGVVPFAICGAHLASSIRRAISCR